MSFSHEDVEQLLAIARDAATGVSFEERMTGLAAQVARVIPHTTTAFCVLPLVPSGEPVRLVQVNSVPEVMREYAEHYHKLDPSHERCRALIGTPFLLSDVVPHDQYGKDEYTSDCLQRARCRHILGGWLPLPRGMALQLTFARPEGTDDFDAREIKIAKLIAPDLVRAAFGTLLSEQMKEIQTQRRADPTVGLVVFDTAGEVVFAHQGAVSMCERAAPHGGAPGDVLAPLILRLRAPRTAHGTTVECTIRLNDDNWVHVTATRTRDTIVCLLERLAPGTPKHSSALSASHGLTARELEVASLAIKGLANKEIAHALKLSPITVKLHLSKVFKKLRVNSRTALAALMLGSGKSL